MKAFITLCHKNHAYDGSITFLFKAIEKTSLQECDVVIFPITYQNEYVVDQDLMQAIEDSGKKIVIVDFTEYNWDVLTSDHIFGINTHQWLHKFENKEYIKLDDFFIRNMNRIVLYFKRELPVNLKIKTPFKILPAEYLGIVELPDNKVDSFEEFNNRPIDVMMIWGLSNPSRPIMHGEMCKQAATNGMQLVTNLDHITQYQKEGRKRMCVMVMNPDFARESMHKILHLQSYCKISISLGGSGRKCFRDAEASYNSVMARQENNLEWTYPWIDGFNAIELPNKQESVFIDEERSYQRIARYLERPEQLYSMYLQGINNWKNYSADNYSNNYILKEIQNAI